MVEFGLLAIGLALFLAMRRRDTRDHPLLSLPTYGTPEAARLQDAISGAGSRLVCIGEHGDGLAAIERPRSEEEFLRLIRPGGWAVARSWRRSRCKPVRPKQRAAPKARPGSAPARFVVVLADRCRICNRALTNLESRQRGVGPDCFRTYGPRVIHAPNSLFDVWTQRKALLEAQHAAWGRLLSEIFEEQMRRYEAEMQAWVHAVAMARQPMQDSASS